MKPDNNWCRQKYWNEQRHQNFYRRLREQPMVEQRRAIICQVNTLSHHGRDFPGNYQAAESLLGFLLQNLSNTAEEKAETMEMISLLQRRMEG